MKNGRCCNCDKEFTSLEARWFVVASHEYVCGTKCYSESFARSQAKKAGEYDDDLSLSQTFHKLPK